MDPVPIDLEDVGTVAAVVGTAAAVPFVQGLATRAADDAYSKLRHLFSRALGRQSSELTETLDTTTGPALHVVSDSVTNTRLELRGNPTDEALRKLAEADLETLAAPDPSGRPVVVYFAAGRWQRHVERD